eukprot:CAMPEP_0181505074 /NCGR_PEP_ID=MMETSP1110-20121109/57861_1 /TAXON_ID=174948 /ORGANISM="Symbiodinium sp., Strain CCMP421" /LENGTH=152 /DNA_ID=CAMNT_0023634029 /DNA_START=32 /DNA_END=487 /DNA_ORIENTATION=-
MPDPPSFVSLTICCVDTFGNGSDSSSRLSRPVRNWLDQPKSFRAGALSARVSTDSEGDARSRAEFEGVSQTGLGGEHVEDEFEGIQLPALVEASACVGEHGGLQFEAFLLSTSAGTKEQEEQCSNHLGCQHRPDSAPSEAFTASASSSSPCT